MTTDLIDKKFWTPIGEASISKAESFKYYVAQPIQTFGLHTEVFNKEGIKVYDNSLYDFQLRVFFIVIEKLYKGKVKDTAQFFIGTSQPTIRTAYAALLKNRLRYRYRLSKAESVLRYSDIPYVKGVTYTVRSFVRRKVKLSRPDIEQTATIKIRAYSKLLEKMIEIDNKRRQQDALFDSEFPLGLLESATTVDK